MPINIILLQCCFQPGGEENTYIRMPADLLDDIVIEVSGVSQELLPDVVRVLQPAEHIVQQRDLTTFPQLSHLELPGSVNILHPAVMVLGAVGGNVLLEFDNVRVRNDLGVFGGKERSCITVNALMAEGRRGRSASCQAECDKPAHDDDGVIKCNAREEAESIRV
jgi:hypothetical protein